MPHPKRRTWALGTLDQEVVYRLWFDPEAFRWEADAVGTRSEQREDLAATRARGTDGAAGKRSAAGAGRPPRPRDGGTSRARAAS